MSAPVMIMAGGTGGHIFPGIAVAQELRRLDVPVEWLGAAGGMEAELVPQHDLPFHAIRVGRLRGQGLKTRLLAPVAILRAVWSAIGILRTVRPRAVLSMGGFAAGPGGLAAWLLRIPLLVHEQNTVPGLTNRVLARLAARVMTGFPDTFDDAVHVGNPVRDSISRLPAPAERMADHQLPANLLVLGGSQGARSLNEVVPAGIAQLATDRRPHVRHQVGKAHESTAVRAYREAGVEADVLPFIDDMAAAYGWADLVVCRAGALTIAELAAAGVGAILIPFPHAVDDHQTTNAAFLVEQGAAELMPEADLTPRALADRLQTLTGDRELLLQMATRAREQARPNAAGDAARLCLEVAA